MKNTVVKSGAVFAVAALALAGCGEAKNASSSDGSGKDGSVINISSTDDACTASAAEASSGTVTFNVKNDGGKITEFYLLASDGLRIVGERENITPGSSAELTVTLQPGEYFTACKPGMRGDHVGKAALKVTGDPVELEGEDKELFEAAVSDYINFVKNEVAELAPKAEEFAQAYIAKDDNKAREMFAKMRVHYERIEPIAEALGVLDPRIDYREIDYLAEADSLKEDDPTFTEWLGFHRIEKDLWPPAADAVQPDGTSAHDGWKPSTDADRKRIGETLISDINKLYDTVHAENYIAENDINIATISNGATSLLEEIANNKVTGEENWWSHYDLWDFQANLDGAKIAFDLVAPIAERKSDDGKKLVEKVRSAIADLQAELDKYGSLDKGFTLYNEVTSSQQKELVVKLNAVREPMSKLTSTILGISQ